MAVAVRLGALSYDDILNLDSSAYLYLRELLVQEQRR